MGLEKAKLTAKQQRAIEALLTEPTVQAAADAAGVGKTTIFRWLADSVFSSVYRDLRGQALETTLTRLQQVSGDAVEALREIMTDKAVKSSARVAAARSVLDLALRAREVLETEARLRALEDRLNAQQPTPGRKIR
jgi:AcrR family transcriptional regulator